MPNEPKAPPRRSQKPVATAHASASGDETLSLEHLRSFLAVVDHGSQARAARKVRTSQPTLGRHVERVQAHFGGRLFEQGASGALSTRGRLVEQTVRAVLADLGLTRERLAAERPVLRIGYIRLVRPLMETALRQQARVRGGLPFDVRLFELPSEEQAHKLRVRELDIAICYALDALSQDSEGIHASRVTEQPFALVVPERAWHGTQPSLRALESLHYVHLPRNFSAAAVDSGWAWLKQRGLTPRRTIVCELATELLAYAAAGVGYGFLPALWSTASHQGAIVAPVTDFACTITIAAYSLSHVSPAVARLRESLSVAAGAALHGFVPSP